MKPSQSAEAEIAEFYGDEEGRLPPDVAARLIGNALIQTVTQVQWTEDLVERRLIDALELLERVESRPGPRFKSGVMPIPGIDWALLNEMQRSGELDKFYEMQNREPRYGGHARDVTDAHRAIGWPMRYLSAERYAKRERQCLDAFLRAEVFRTTAWWNGSGHPKTSAYRLKDRAVRIILAGVMKDGVLP